MLGAVGMDMPIGGGGGDIWSTGAFASFESSLKDLLDSGDYTLDQLLAEDELLQELRGCHQPLMAYFSTEQAVAKLVQYVILAPTPSPAPTQLLTKENDANAAQPPPKTTTPPLEVDAERTGFPNNTASATTANGPSIEAGAADDWLGLLHPNHLETNVYNNGDSNATKTKNISDDELLHQQHQRHIRFPYMACEIICCEIPGVIDTLVDGYCDIAVPSSSVSNSNNNNNKDAISSFCAENDTNNSIMERSTGSPTKTTNDDDNAQSPPRTTTDITEIVTSGSQGDMVEVIAVSMPEASSLDSTNNNDDDDDGEEDAGNAEEKWSPNAPQSSPPQRVRILDVLFSFLYDTPVGELDDYRAGYFDKVLTVLFRKRPVELTMYINEGGARGRPALIQSMLNHLYSHSIMQIAQRLLLPQRPVDESQQQQQQLLQMQMQQQQDGGDEIIAGNDDEDEAREIEVQCDWGSSPEVLDMLLDTLVGPSRDSSSTDGNPGYDEDRILDLSLNASEVLITIIQNSMLSSATMLALTSGDSVARIVDAATKLPDPNYFTPHESLLTSALNVLESLVLQLGGYGAVGTMSLMPEEELALQQQEELVMSQIGQLQTQEEPTADDIFAEDPPEAMKARISSISLDAQQVLDDGLKDSVGAKHLISDLGTMLLHLPLLLERLYGLLHHPSTKTWVSPMQFSPSNPQQLLGNSRLRIVRVLESLVLLGDPDVDSRLVQSDCLETCLDFFWEFQWCSMLHQSVANLLVHVFEGQNARFEMQEYFLVKCNLLGRLMTSFVENEATHVTRRFRSPEVGPASDGSNSSADDQTSADARKIQTSDAKLVSASVGDPFTVGGSLTPVDTPPTTPMGSTDGYRLSDIHSALSAQSFRYGYMGHVIIICQALVHAYSTDQDLLDSDGPENSNFEGAQENGGYEQPRVVSGGYLDSERVNDEVDITQDSREDAVPKDDFGEPLLLFEIVHTHELAERWHDFVDTTLAAESAVQSTPLGGFGGAPEMDPMFSQRPGLADEGYMMGDDGEGPPVPPRGMLGGGDTIDMDDYDLDVAASMMAGLSLRRASPAVGEDDNSHNSGDSEKSYNSGDTASEKTAYAFDDPLGKAGGLGIELGKLTQYAHSQKEAAGDEDDGSHSSSDEEPESNESNDGDVPVIDLFTGNLNYTDSEEAFPAPEFANFADFDTAEEIAPTATANNEAFSMDHIYANEVSNSAVVDEIFDQGNHSALLLEMDDTPLEAAAITIVDDTSSEQIVPVDKGIFLVDVVDVAVEPEISTVVATPTGAQDEQATVTATPLNEGLKVLSSVDSKPEMEL